MRTESAASAKSNRPSQRMPRPGTRLRELWDLLHVYRGEFVEQNLTSRRGRFNPGDIEMLKNFYGLDIRCFGRAAGYKGRGSAPGRWCLVGEWFGREYKDYLAERIAKKETPKC